MDLGAIEPWQWAVAAVAASIVGVGKTGMPGVGILGVPLMAWAFGGKPSVGTLLPMLIFADCFAVFYYRRHAQWDKLWKLVPWVLPGFAIGAALLWAADGVQLFGLEGKDWFKPLIGLIVLAMLGLNLARKRWGDQLTPHSPAMVAATGTGAGAATTLANAAGPIMTVYLAGMRMPKEQFMGTNAWFFLLVNVAKVPIYIALTLLQPQTPMFTGGSLLLGACLIPVILLGVALGRWLLPRIPQRVFDAAILILAAAAALRLVLDPVLG